MSAPEKKSSVVLFLLTLVVSSVTFISSLAPFVNPSTFWIIAIAGLGFYYIYIINFLFLIVWITKRKKTFLIPLIPFLIGFTTALSFVRINFSHESVTTKNTLDVMTYNVRIFDLQLDAQRRNTREDF